MIKFYQVISLLNYLNKVIEKLVVIQLSEVCEAKKKLHKDEIKGRKQWTTIDVTTIIIYKIYEIWKNQHVAKGLLIDVKKAFDYVF